MAFTPFTTDVENISKLDDRPNAGGMTASELKAEFDKAGKDIKAFLVNFLSELQGSGAAGNIGFSSDDMDSNNIKSAIEEAYDKAVNSEVGTLRLANLAVVSAKIKDGAVTRDKIADNAVIKKHLNTSLNTRYDTFTISSDAAAWEEEDDGGFSYTISSTVYDSTDIPKIYFKAPSSFENLDACQEAFSLLYKCETTQYSGGLYRLKLYAKAKPASDFSILAEVMKI